MKIIARVGLLEERCARAEARAARIESRAASAERVAAAAKKAAAARWFKKPDKTVKHEPDACKKCGGASLDAVEKRTKNQAALPDPQPDDVMRHEAGLFRCTICGTKAYTRGDVTDGLYDASVIRRITYLAGEMNMTLSEARAELRDMHGLDIRDLHKGDRGEGTIMLAPMREMVREAILVSPYACMDERAEQRRDERVDMDDGGPRASVHDDQPRQGSGRPLVDGRRVRVDGHVRRPRAVPQRARRQRQAALLLAHPARLVQSAGVEVRRGCRAALRAQGARQRGGRVVGWAPLQEDAGGEGSVLPAGGREAHRQVRPARRQDGKVRRKAAQHRAQLVHVREDPRRAAHQQPGRAGDPAPGPVA